jgi:hexosaminidase
MVADFGYKPCAWGALTHASGQTPVRAGKDVMMDIWYNPYYQPAEALDAGYTIVSVPDGLVYIVPYAGYYYDYLNCKYLYESWEPRRVGNYTVPDGYMDKLAGGKFALWNDCLGKKKNGERYVESDNWDRIYPALQTLSQKMWTGVRTDQTWEQFAALADGKREPEGVKSSHKTTLSK